MQQIALFIAVGIAAASTHLAVAAAAVELAALRPLAANAIGFAIAFFVSFGGHARFTFPIERERFTAARLRFFAVAFTGFALNLTAYPQALKLTGPDYYLLDLAAVLVGVAVATFLLSKLWAFAQPQG